MPELIVANEYTNIHAYRWIAPKPKPTLKIAEPKDPSQGREELARIREMSDSHLGQHRLPDQENLKDKQRQVGKAMESSELVAKVKKLNPRLVVEDSLNCRGHASFYHVTPAGEKTYTNANFKKGVLPEFSVIETDAADLPIRVQYGWREVLLRLVKARQLSFRQVVRMFGDAETVQGLAWRRNIRHLRG
jgi:hypothetical protein